MDKEKYKKQLKFPLEELRRLQALPLEDKIALSKIRIEEWYAHWNGKVCVNFSGGKDSTVLLHLVREMYPDVPAVYADTRLDLPEVREFVKQTPNVTFVKPLMDFREVIKTFGWVFPSKNVAQYVGDARRGVKYAVQLFDGKNSDGTPSPFNRDRYSRWKFLVDAPFKISPKCCEFMKEKPLNKYTKETGNMPYVGLMACESARREIVWRKTGCNAFNTKNPMGRPMMFWKEQDVFNYILKHGLKIASCYGDIVEKKGKFTTTKEQRTGCAFCLIGAHLDKDDSRMKRLKETHPELYKYCLEQLGMKVVLDWLKIPY